MSVILKDGTRLESGNKSFHYFIQHISTGNNISRFATVDRCKEELERTPNPEDYRIVGDWVLVRG